MHVYLSENLMRLGENIFGNRNINNLIVIAAMRILPEIIIPDDPSERCADMFFPATGRKVLFVPDDCIDKYRNDKYWSTFPEIYPMSEYKEKTAIKSVKSSQPKSGKQRIYTVSGMHVNDMRDKGFYIVVESDGTTKKMMVK